MTMGAPKAGGRAPRHMHDDGRHLLLAAAAVLAAGAVAAAGWGSVEISSMLSRGHWVHGAGPSPSIVWALCTSPTRLYRLWPPGQRRFLAPALARLLFLGTPPLAAVAALSPDRSRRRLSALLGNRSPRGFATARDVARHLSGRAVLAKAPYVRPDLGPSLRIPPEECAVRLGATPRGTAVFASLEDAVLVIGPPRSGKGVHLVIHSIVDAPGAVVSTSTRADTLRATLRERSRKGDAFVFDPQGAVNGDLGIRGLRWSPVEGCSEPRKAIVRAASLADASGMAKSTTNGEFWSGQTAAVFRPYLMAAALSGSSMRDVVRWAMNPDDDEPVGILRSHPGLPAQWGDDLAAIQAADGQLKGNVWAGVRRALDALADPSVLDACSPDPGDEFSTREFLLGRNTLYLVGSSVSQSTVAPLVAALVEDIVEEARLLARESPSSRLSPPMLLSLDEVANIAPLPTLPHLVTDGGGSGIATMVVLQSLAQARARWGPEHAQTIWEGSACKVILGGLSHAQDLRDISAVIGEAEATEVTRTASAGGGSTSYSNRRSPIVAMEDLRRLPFGRAIVLHRSCPPVDLELTAWTSRAWAKGRPGSGRRRPAAVTSWRRLLPEPGSRRRPASTRSPASPDRRARPGAGSTGASSGRGAGAR